MDLWAGRKEKREERKRKNWWGVAFYSFVFPSRWWAQDSRNFRRKTALSALYDLRMITRWIKRYKDGVAQPFYGMSHAFNFSRMHVPPDRQSVKHKVEWRRPMCSQAPCWTLFLSDLRISGIHQLNRQRELLDSCNPPGVASGVLAVIHGLTLCKRLLLRSDQSTRRWDEPSRRLLDRLPRRFDFFPLNSQYDRCRFS